MKKCDIEKTLGGGYHPLVARRLSASEEGLRGDDCQFHLSIGRLCSHAMALGAVFAHPGGSHIFGWQSHSPTTQWSYGGAALPRRKPHSPTSTVYSHLDALKSNAIPCNAIDFSGHY